MDPLFEGARSFIGEERLLSLLDFFGIGAHSDAPLDPDMQTNLNAFDLNVESADPADDRRSGIDEGEGIEDEKIVVLSETVEFKTDPDRMVVTRVLKQPDGAIKTVVTETTIDSDIFNKFPRKS